MAADCKAADRALELARQRGVIRVRDLLDASIHPETLRRLYAQGLLVRTGRGLYALANGDYSEHLSLAEAAARVPGGIICLLSALQYHGIGTQNPRQVWIMIDRRAHHPRVQHPPLRVVLASGAALTEGVEHQKVDGVDVRITNVAKTVVDCFKYRNKVGLDVALEALRETRRARRYSADELWRYAAICRVTRIMRPYLEAVG